MQSIIIGDIQQANGARHITESHTDDIGVVHTVSYFAPADADINALMSARALLIASNLISSDKSNAIERLLNGENPLDMTFNYCTNKQAAEVLIRFGMESREPYILLLLKPLIEYLKATYTVAQIANYLDITTTQLSRVWTRYNAILDREDFLNSDSELAEVIDG